MGKQLDRRWSLQWIERQHLFKEVEHKIEVRELSDHFSKTLLHPGDELDHLLRDLFVVSDD